MRKNICLLLALIMIFTLVGCADSAGSKTQVNNDTALESTPSAKTDRTEQFSPDTKEEIGSVDVDLTALSSTMVYSEVYNMMYEPDKYIGKIVRMNGQFVAYTNQDQSQFYPAVIIADATSCCSQGLEFVLAGENSYPDGYPEIYCDITVVGTFETYQEDGYQYCHLVNAVIE